MKIREILIGPLQFSLSLENLIKCLQKYFVDFTTRGYSEISIEGPTNYNDEINYQLVGWREENPTERKYREIFDQREQQNAEEKEREQLKYLKRKYEGDESI